MLSQSRIFVLLAAAALLPAAAARAQVYGASQPAPLYPYAMQSSAQSDQPYAVEVSPGTYVIQRSAPSRAYPYIRSQRGGRGILTQPAAPAAGKFDRPHKPVDHALVEELRQRHQSKDNVNTTQIVRDPPVVHETRRIVDDPPRVITRKHIIEDQPDGSQTMTVEESAPEQHQIAPVQRPSRDDNKKRVIAADAEVTILGPDRMMIRLFRKGQGPKASARAD